MNENIEKPSIDKDELLNLLKNHLVFIIEEKETYSSDTRQFNFKLKFDETIISEEVICI